MTAVRVLLVVLSGCSAAFEPPTDALSLSIADRPWAEHAPLEGWCGETSIQMAALHFGAWLPQAHVNQAGRPAHVDLWEEDVPVALTALGLRFETGPRKKAPRLLSWVVDALRRGHPVILGLKLVPTEHPDWDVDHLVLAVGFSPEGLLLNTNLEPGQVTAAWSGLLQGTGALGLSLISPSGAVFGYEVLGATASTGPAVELLVRAETPTEVTLEVHVTGLVGGNRYLLQRNGAAVETFVANGTERTVWQDVKATSPTRFTCVVSPE